MKKLFFAFLCLVSLTMFTACEGGKNDPEKDGKWYTAASQINLSDFDNEDKKCWAIDIWCDGTTLGREFAWLTEAEVASAAKLILTLDYQVFGYNTKKVKWFEADANDEDACDAMVWEGARCWEETITAPNGESETEYGWMPEENMKERHDHYVERGLQHEYKPADANDPDACDALNPEEPTDPENPSTESKCWKVTLTVGGQSTTVYTWAPEASIQAQISAAQMAGGSGTYEPADANDEESCALLNN